MKRIYRDCWETKRHAWWWETREWNGILRRHLTVVVGYNWKNSAMNNNCTSVFWNFSSLHVRAKTAKTPFEKKILFFLKNEFSFLGKQCGFSKLHYFSEFIPLRSASVCPFTYLSTQNWFTISTLSIPPWIPLVWH